MPSVEKAWKCLRSTESRTRIYFFMARAASANTGQEQLFVIAGIVPFQSCVKPLPRVRLELTTFRLWDWRAAYCANEAPVKRACWCMNKWLITKLLHIVALSGKMLPESGRASYHLNPHSVQGELAQMVERSLSMREVAGSMPAFSKKPNFLCLYTTGIHCTSFSCDPTMPFSQGWDPEYVLR